jgi:hypothetical protein
MKLPGEVRKGSKRAGENESSSNCDGEILKVQRVIKSKKQSELMAAADKKQSE